MQVVVGSNQVGRPDEGVIYSRVDASTVRSLGDFRREHTPRTLNVRGFLWPYVSLAEGEPAVCFLHGLAGAYDIWWQQIQTLRSGFRVLSLTYPAVDTLSGLAEGVLAVLKHEGIETTAIVGSSLGGYIAQYILGKHPERLTGVVLSNTFPPNTALIKRYGIVGRLLPYVPAWLVRFVLDQSTQRNLYPASGHSELVRAYVLEGARQTSKAQIYARYRCVMEPFSPPDLEALGVPALIVEADNDPLLDASLRGQLKAAYPSAAVHTFHAAGHFPYLNRPAAYSALLVEFLSRNVDRTFTGHP